MSSQKIRLLHIEDSESDSALLVRLLQRAGYDVEFERVEDADGIREAMKRRQWDVVLADYQLPSFSADAALETMREIGEDVPFIVVSGSIDASTAVDLMKAGAHDYVMKGDLTRLPPAVAREIREARARRARREAEERLELAVNATQLGTFDYYPQTGELIWSDCARKHFGVNSGAPLSYDLFLRALHPDDRDRVHNLLQGVFAPGSTKQFSIEYRTIGIEDGVERFISAQGRAFFDSQGQPVRSVGVTLDVTERKRLEDQFRQAQKLESIGRLAGAVAHDFNNLLTLITGYGQMLLDDLTIQDAAWEAANEICGAADRATALTRQLLTFSRKQASEPREVILNDLVQNFEKMLRRLLGPSVQLLLELDENPGVVHADPGQIEQVIMNLAVNARDAMPDGGKLVLRTGRQVIAPKSVDGPPTVEAGPYVVLTVVDTGAGMSSDVRAQIFEPFFTTKEPGKGTGLGLSTVYGIVKQSGGVIEVSSELGHGTEFKILLPAVELSRNGQPEFFAQP